MAKETQSAADFLESFLAKFDDVPSSTTPTINSNPFQSSSNPSPSPQKPTSKVRRQKNNTDHHYNEPPTQFQINNRVVQLWGSSKGQHRKNIAKSLITLLQRKGDDALIGNGCFVSCMLLFKRFTANIKLCNLKLQTSAATVPNNVQNLDLNTNSKKKHTNIDKQSLLDSLKVMYHILKLPINGVAFANEFVETNLVLYPLFTISAEVSTFAVRLLEMVYQRTSFIDIFKSSAQLSFYANSVSNINDPTMLTVLLQMLIDNGNPKGIPTLQNEHMDRRAIQELQKMLFHRLPKVRTAASHVIVTSEM